MRRTSALGDLRGIGSLRFGGFCCEVVAGQGSMHCAGQRAAGYGLMIAGIDGCHVGLIAGLDAGWPGRRSLTIDGARIDASCINGGYLGR